MGLHAHLLRIADVANKVAFLSLSFANRVYNCTQRLMGTDAYCGHEGRAHQR